MSELRHAVDIAMMKIARAPAQLYSLGLGSCIGVAIYDPLTKVGGLIHVLLPFSEGFDLSYHPRTKFADSGIADLVEALIKNGASRSRMKAKMAGGASMFVIKHTSDVHEVGKRNIHSSRETLKRLGIELIAHDTGGNKGRTVIFDLETGQMTIKTVDRAVKVI
ncbi:chemotaxis protein CheD [Oscillospiraceae bacterium CM]|nr:chemotaxis protein CheD [Oscillospiraceae bacterium CM]